MSLPEQREWVGIRPLGPGRELAAVWMFVKRDFLLQTHFKLSYFTGLLGTASNLVIYGMIARFGDNVPEIAALAGGYVNFVITGMVLNTLLATALSGPYNGLNNSFWNNRVEMIMASPLRLPVFVLGLSAGGFVDAVIRIAVTLAGATLFLGFTWPAGGAFLRLLVIVALGLFACAGLGLAAASTIYTLDARGGRDPIRFFVETVSGLVAGVFFPLQVLPVWAQWLAHTVPHTYALDGMRRALFGGAHLPLLPIHRLIPLDPFWVDCVALALYAAVIGPVGWRLFRYGMHLARSDGRLSRWL